MGPQPWEPPDDYDQTPRLDKFRAAHPEWKIRLDRDLGRWCADTESPDGGERVTRYELRDLLDTLERRYR